MEVNLQLGMVAVYVRHTRQLRLFPTLQAPMDLAAIRLPLLLDSPLEEMRIAPAR